MTRPLIVAGVDPASTTGITVLRVDADAPALVSSWRWVTAARIAKAHSTKRTPAMNALALYYLAHKMLSELAVTLAVIERPSDMGAWIGIRGGQGQRGQSTGTAFAIGEAYGMLASAAFAAGATVISYPVTSRRANPAKKKLERIGWMPIVGGRVAKREHTLAALHDLSVDLRARPADGVLCADRADPLDENILMSLGVLEFHLRRQTRL